MSTYKLAVLILFCVPVWAQYTTGRVDGTVFDSSGAPTPGAALTLKSLQTNAERSYLTGEGGAYTFAAVAPGAYEVSVSKAGFAAATAMVQVYSSQTTTQNFTLALAGQAQTISVVGEATPELRVSEALRSTTRNTLEVQTLPTQGRNISGFITLAPGVTPTFSPRGGNLTTISIAQAGQLNANGGRSKATAHQLDFTDANDWEFGGIALATQPNPEMLQEVRVLANNWAAEYGVKSNAQVVMITRSGSNSLHGSAYNFLQNGSLNARDYFDRTGKQTPLRQNFFGFTAGGPVVKDKTFVFGGYEGRRTRGAGTTQVFALPSEAARASVTNASVRQILGLLPVPNTPTANPLIGTLSLQTTTPSDSNQFVARGDHYFTDTHSLTVRYFQNLGTSVNRTAGSLPGFDATFDPRGRNAMIADTWVLSPRATNELRLAYGRSSALFSPETEPATPRFSVPGLAGFGTVQSWPQGRIFNVYQINDAFSYNRGQHLLRAGFDLRHIQDNSVNDSNRRGIYSFGDINTFLAGTPSSYTQMFGNTYRGFRTNYHAAFVQDDWKVMPTLTLNLGFRWEFQGGLREVNRLQSVLDPRLNTAIGAAGTGALGGFRNESPVVEGTSFLPGPRFGFAWNPGAGRWVVRGGYGIYFDSLIFNGLQAGRTTPPTNYTGTLTGAANFTGANSLENLLAGTSEFQRTFNALVGGFGTAANLGSITSTEPDLRNPYAQHFSLGVQRRFTSSLVADASYVGTRGTALTTFGPANSVIRRPAPAVSLEDERARAAEFQQSFARQNGAGNSRIDPRFNDVNLLRDNGSSTYHSLQMELRKSISWGLQFQAMYTWSKSIDNSSDYSPGQAITDRSYAQDQFNFRAERALSQFDIPHRFILSHVWQLPFFRGQQGVAGKVLGGWTWASINQWQRGVPYTIVSGPRTITSATGTAVPITDVNLDGQGSGVEAGARASCAAGGASFEFGGAIPAPNQRGVNGAANASNFRYVQPLFGNNGTCGRNTERLNNLLNFDWTLSKNIRLFESGPMQSGPWNLEFRTDFFNIFNVPYLTAAGDDFRSLASSNFGVANAAGATRRLQMALRLTF
ncbi:MAG: carboxypeptidase regulatory-like domain-containing protein [Bryobacteraceae bacterium]|nr:carboxypeptidase regulatory-like domain-containing protein [Bryobacteraceae bacterium]